MVKCLLILSLLMSGPFKYEWPDIGSPEWNLEKEVEKPKPKPKNKHILYFTATWCGPCNQIQKPILNGMKQTGWKIGDKVKVQDDHFWQYDFDQSPVEVEKYSITQVPTFILVDGDGKEIHRDIGTRTPQQLLTLYQLR